MHALLGQDRRAAAAHAWPGANARSRCPQGRVPLSSNTRWIAQRFGALHSAKAATEDDDAFGARPWRGKQLTSTGKLVTTDKLPVRCVLRWILFILNSLLSHARNWHKRS